MAPYDTTVNWKNYIAGTPSVLRGRPRIKGTRIPVSLVLGYLATGKTVQDVIEEFSGLSEDHILACLAYARDLSEFGVGIP